MFEGDSSKFGVDFVDSDTSIPDFIKSEKIDDALKSVFRQEIQIYMYNQENQNDRKQLLAFPTLLTSRSRFILHSVVSAEFSTLVTFSVGKDPNRRCYVARRDIFMSINR